MRPARRRSPAPSRLGCSWPHARAVCRAGGPGRRWSPGRLRALPTAGLVSSPGREGSMGDILIRGGTVVDGTGAPGRQADVRVRAGIIAEVGPRLAPDGEQQVDASGAFVIPGIIDTHTHLDGAM